MEQLSLLPPALRTSRALHFPKILRDRYNLLVPRQEDGLIVLAIYQKVRAGVIERTFPERIITETIKQVLDELGQGSARGEETQKYDETLHRLLRHFLDKNIEEKTYQLSSYGENFCDLLEREVHTAINPSQIQKTFTDLVLLLNLKLENIEDFRHWYHTQFFKHKNDISAQLRALQAQIEDTVDQLNDLVKNEVENFREMLIACEALLDRIKEQADKLSSAFSSKDDIKQMLDDAGLSDEFEFRTMKREVRNYFKDMEARLINVSHTIDRIKPKVNKLYNDFEKRDFDRKIETFLLYLFKNSTSKFYRTKKLKDRRVHEVEVFLPKGIHEVELYMDRSRLMEPEYMQLLEPPPIQLHNHEWDVDDLHRQAENRRRQIERDKRVEDWFNKISADLEKKKKVNFGDYYYQILFKDNDYEEAIKEATMVLKEFSKMQNVEVTVREEFQLDPKQPNIGIWKMQLKNTAS
ncbi:MAG TPA: hypothetical protein VL651_00130 [Bacteroidia bacterium]|nr:hypothetical protein [Bacteroidia bacterium]